MSGSALRMSSPSSSTRTRSTPWVLGCDGPTFSSMVSVRGMVWL